MKYIVESINYNYLLTIIYITIYRRKSDIFSGPLIVQCIWSCIYICIRISFMIYFLKVLILIVIDIGK